MAGWFFPKATRAPKYEKAISVAQGTAQPRDSSGRCSALISTKNVIAGIAMPPTAASSGTADSRGEASAPPGNVASNTSFVASAKKNTMPMSFTAKCNACVKCS